jgi:hypothetical protein
MATATMIRIVRSGSTASRATPAGMVTRVAASINDIERHSTRWNTPGSRCRLATTSSSSTVGTTLEGA